MSEMNEEIRNIDEAMAEEIPPAPVAPEAPQPNFSQNDYNGANVNMDSSYVSQNPDDETGKILAIISLITGILSILCCCSVYIGVVLSVSAIVCGIISIKKSDVYKTIAIIGLVCGSVGVLLAIVGIILQVVFGLMGLMTEAFEAMF